MSGINRLQSKLNKTLGLNEWGQREIVPGSMDDELIETNQQFGTGTIPSSKIKNLKVDTITITPTGYIKLGKDSFTDSTNAGYYFSAEGIYIGSATDTNYLKYTIGTGVLTFKGVVDGASTIGGRVASTLASAIDASGHFADDAISTATQSILGSFTFGASGAIQIGSYVNGVTGDIKISPTGILGRDKTGATTFSINATTGVAVLNGLVVGTNVGLGTAQDSAGVTTIIGDTVTTSFVNALNITAASMSVGGLTSGTIASKTITLALTGITDDCYINYGKTDFDNTQSGFILGIDNSDNDRAKFYIGDSNYYLNWTGTALNINGAVVDGTSTIGGRLASTLSSAIDVSGHFADNAINTATGTIVSPFSFGVSGAIQIGTYQSGVTGDIKISPSGILGRDKNNATTFSIDATTGVAVLNGLVVGTNVGLGTAQDSAGVTTIVGNTVTTSFVNALNITAASMSVGGLTSGTISSKTITLAVAAGTGDSYIAAGKTDFTNTDAGFILGIDDSDSDKSKFYIGDSTHYMNWDGTNFSILGGSITGGTIKTNDTTYPDVLINSSGLTIHGDKLFVKNTDGTVGGLLRTSSTLFTLEAETNRSLRLIAYNDFTINTHYDDNIMTYSSSTGNLAVKTSSGHATFEGYGNAYLTAVVGDAIIDGGGTVNIISGDNVINCSANILKLSSSKTPSASNDTGVTGSICWDANYIYVCTATNTWKRAGIATW